MHSIKKLTVILLLLMLVDTGFASEANTYNRITYQVSEQKEVNNDEILSLIHI